VALTHLHTPWPTPAPVAVPSWQPAFLGAGSLGETLPTGGWLVPQGPWPCTVPAHRVLPWALFRGSGGSLSASAVVAVAAIAHQSLRQAPCQGMYCTRLLRVFKGVRAPTFLTRVKPQQLSHCTASVWIGHSSTTTSHTKPSRARLIRRSSEPGRPSAVALDIPSRLYDTHCVPNSPSAWPADLLFPWNLLPRPSASSLGNRPDWADQDLPSTPIVDCLPTDVQDIVSCEQSDFAPTTSRRAKSRRPDRPVSEATTA
jgi:hypothetical protein